MKRPLAIAAVFSTCALLGTAAAALDYRPQAVAELQGLDKITARISTFKVPVGETAKFGSLEITVDACYRTPPEELPESASFVKISDVHDDGRETSEQLFSGWMFASTPGLSGMEHPVYDVWLKECVSKKEAQAAPQGQPAPKDN
ncbi:DUF2155 domain-containing protein [Thalassospira lucentensis]|uniref:DUF2155 domain-containing protein n=1 Tax=Thalassospira lucentensis TaxID=168935 RepID=UPI003AA91318